MSSAVAQRLIIAGMSAPEAERKAQLFAEVDALLSHARADNALRWFVPGRIEVLGKHTDYAGGRSLLCAAERGICIAAIPRDDATVRIRDVVRHQELEFPLSPDASVPELGWTVYPQAVARRLARNFPGGMRGADVVFASDLPSAAGMSSSSALVIATFAVLSAVNQLPDRSEYVSNIESLEDLAGYLGCVENGQSYKSLLGDAGVGTFGGSEDHTAILSSRPGHLKQYSFCPVRLEQTMRLPPDCVFVIAVSGVVADKTGSARSRYNCASQACKDILNVWRAATGSEAQNLAALSSAGDGSPDRLRAVLREHSTKNAPSLIDRFDQFHLESELIIPGACDALAHDNLARFGELVDQSQDAAEKLLGNQVPETIWLARQARRLGAHAASAFGAGFGGSVWALVENHTAGEFASRWRASYREGPYPAAHNSDFFVTKAGPALTQL